MSSTAEDVRAEHPADTERSARPSDTGEGETSGVSRRPRWWIYAILGVGLVLVVAPFVWMLLSSIKSQGELLRNPFGWIPDAPTLDNYGRLFTSLNFPRFLTNSTVVAVAVTASNLLFCSMMGYALAKLQFKGRKPLFSMVMATLMVPSAVWLVPMFVLMSNLRLLNTYWALILPFAAGPFGVFMMRQFMHQIPDELLDAGRVDGASEWYLFWRIALPMSLPALATLGILTFMQTWNMFLWPLISATDEKMYTLPVALGTFARGQHQSDYGLLMAGAVLIVLPTIAIFVALQRYFRPGDAQSGLK